MFRFLRNLGINAERNKAGSSLDGKTAGRPMTIEDQVDRAQRLFCGCLMLSGLDPFTGDSRSALPLIWFGGDAERRDTS